MWRWDEQWLRLLDVDAALAARTYNDVDASVTIAVTDAILPANDGVFEISAAGAKRATIEAVDADLAAGIADISAAYLGGTWWSNLADAGRVEVRSPAGLDAADRLFVSRRAPFCNSGF
jgi:predicted acetyltransferase